MEPRPGLPIRFIKRYVELRTTDSRGRLSPHGCLHGLVIAIPGPARIESPITLALLLC